VNRVSLIWSTVTIFLLSGLVFTNSKIFLVFLVAWLFRIVCLKDFSILMQALVIAACFFMHFNQRTNLIRQYNQSQNNIELTLKTHPDEIKIMDDGISVRAYTNSINQRGLQAFIPVKTPQDFEKIKSSKNDLIFKIKGNIEPLDKTTNINQFDFRRIMYGKSIYFKVGKCKLVEYDNLTENKLISRIHGWRKQLLERCSNLSEPLQSYCMGIILGEQTDFLKDNSTKLRNMGIIHLFCISGLHVFYFIKLIEFIAIKLKISRETMELVQIGILPIYFVLGGGSTSLFRAVVLVLVQLIAKKLSMKSFSSIDGWCVVLLANLWINPFVLLQMGGQLSYLLSFVLIMQTMDSNWKTSLKLFLVELPIILFSTYKIHVLTVFFNLIVVPIFSSIVVPVVIIAFAIPQLAVVLNPIIMVFEAGLNILDCLPGLVHVGKPSRLLTMITVVLALKIIAMDQGCLKKRLLTTYCVIWMGLWGFFKLDPFGEITFFDVGQGDSILVREPFNQTITMVDTGGKMQFGKNTTPVKHTIAKNSSINYLQSIGITKLNNLCLTHQDVDHIGEASEILNNFTVKKLIFPVGVETTDNYRRKILPFVRNTKVITCLQGMKINRLPMEIKYPFQAGKGENGDSLVLSGKFGGKRVLLTGDLDLNGEHKIIESGMLNQHVDIFKLGHHGSKTSNSAELLEAITPNLAIVSAGRNNRYGHPNQEVIERLDSMRIPHVSTQDKGMISYRYFFNGVGRWKTGIDEKESIVQ
jgi:competence protein ComEC